MCASGQAQFAIEAQDTMAAAIDSDNPLGITAVAGLIQHNTSGIISRKGDGIDSPKGLEGKTYSTWESPIEQATLKTVMKDEGADFSKVKLIPNNITDEPAALKAKQTDAIVIAISQRRNLITIYKKDIKYLELTKKKMQLILHLQGISTNQNFCLPWRSLPMSGWNYGENSIRNVKRHWQKDAIIMESSLPMRYRLQSVKWSMD